MTKKSKSEEKYMTFEDYQHEAVKFRTATETKGKGR